jgi:hypothetical protein
VCQSCRLLLPQLRKHVTAYMALVLRLQRFYHVRLQMLQCERERGACRRCAPIHAALEERRRALGADFCDDDAERFAEHMCRQCAGAATRGALPEDADPNPQRRLQIAEDPAAPIGAEVRELGARARKQAGLNATLTVVAAVAKLRSRSVSPAPRPGWDLGGKRALAICNRAACTRDRPFMDNLRRRLLYDSALRDVPANATRMAAALFATNPATWKKYADEVCQSCRLLLPQLRKHVSAYMDTVIMLQNSCRARAQLRVCLVERGACHRCRPLHLALAERREGLGAAFTVGAQARFAALMCTRCGDDVVSGRGARPHN